MKLHTQKLVILATVAAIALFFVDSSRSQEPTEIEWPPTSVEQIPFISGFLMAPDLFQIPRNAWQINNYSVEGQTHWRIHYLWKYLEEDGEGIWDLSEVNNCQAWCSGHSTHPTKLFPYQWPQFVPPYYENNPGQYGYEKLTEYDRNDPENQSVTPNYMMSPWAPGMRDEVNHDDALNHLWQKIYEDATLPGYPPGSKYDLDHIAVGFPCSDFAEVGFICASDWFYNPHPELDNWVYKYFEQPGAYWHIGYWCNDDYARQDFKDWAWDKYEHNIRKINYEWGQSWTEKEDIVFPTDKNELRYWLDFIAWYKGSITDLTEYLIQTVRDRFPDQVLSVKLAFWGDWPGYGLDRTAVTYRMADYKPFTINAMHSSTTVEYENEKHLNISYYFYKRVAPLCQHLGLGVGNEPVGGTLTEDQLKLQFFEDASAGMNHIFTYFLNYHIFNNTVNRWKAVLRPWEYSCVDIAILFPSIQVEYEEVEWLSIPEDKYQIHFCNDNRDCFDYDIVDENMIGWDLLDNYKVLINTSGYLLEQESLNRIDAWIRAGGLLVNRTNLIPQNVEEDTTTADSWYDETPKTVDGFLFYPVDDGAVVDVALEDAVAAIKAAPSEFAHLEYIEGFDGLNDGIRNTQFPQGFLRFEDATLETYFTERDQDFDALMSAAGFDPLTDDHNGNNILDSDEFALLGTIMKDQGFAQSNFIFKGFYQNYLQARYDIENPEPGYMLNIAYLDRYPLMETHMVLAAYMALGDQGSIAYVTGWIPYLDASDYFKHPGVLADYGDLDHDSISNWDEYDDGAGGDRTEYLKLAVSPDFLTLFDSLELPGDVGDFELNSNMIPDFYEFQVISSVLGDPVLYQYPEIRAAWENNWVQMKKDTTDTSIGDWWITVFAAYMTLGDEDSYCFVESYFDIYFPDVTFNHEDYIHLENLLGALNGDLDWDNTTTSPTSLNNEDEYLLSGGDLQVYLEEVLRPDYDAVLTGVGISLSDDENGLTFGNGIYDSDEFALMAKILVESELPWSDPAFQNPVKQAWNNNMTQMIADTEDAQFPFEEERKLHLLTAVAYMTLGDADSQNHAVGYIMSLTYNPMVELERADYDESAKSIISVHEDPDDDDYDNFYEYNTLSNGDRTQYLLNALTPNNP
jgi:hypothetical protein